MKKYANDLSGYIQIKGLRYVKPKGEVYTMEMEGVIAASGDAKVEDYGDGGELSYVTNHSSIRNNA